MGSGVIRGVWLTVFLMQFVHVDVAVAVPGVVHVVPVGESAEEWSGVLGEGVEVEPVDAC